MEARRAVMRASVAASIIAAGLEVFGQSSGWAAEPGATAAMSSAKLVGIQTQAPRIRKMENVARLRAVNVAVRV
jgi:hypothetical protein